MFLILMMKTQKKLLFQVKNHNEKKYMYYIFEFMLFIIDNKSKNIITIYSAFNFDN